MKKIRLLAAATVLAALVADADPSFKLEKLRPRSTPADGAKSFHRFSPEETGITSPNVYNDPRMWGDLFRELTLGAVETGIAVADFDKDRRLDIYAVSKNGPNSLYLQTADYRFMDIARVAGVAGDDSNDSQIGVTAVDINQDGWPDIYLCRFDAPNLLFINNGDATFTERAAEYGLAIRDASVHAGFADYDRDGDLDCYLVTNILDFSESPLGGRDYLLRNEGNGTFTDVTTEAGIWGKSQGHCAIWFDSNQDSWPDLYVANDFETPDRFYLNRGDGSFVDVVDERLPHVTYFSMGADSGDLNNDGLIDYLVADMRDRNREQYMAGMEEIGRGLWDMERVPELIPQYMWNALYLNAGNDRFKETAHLAGLEATGWTWATRMADFDNDGYLDVFFTTGMIRNFVDADLVDKQNVAPSLAARANVWKNSPVRNEPTLAFHNRGDLTFEDVSTAWGLDHNGVSFGCAIADMDGDGDLDLVYTNYNAPASFVRNDMTTGNRFVVQLRADPPNRDAVGAAVTIETDSGRQVRQVFSERGIVSSEPAMVYFGMGGDEIVNRLTIRWPRGQKTVLEDLPAGHLLTVEEPPVDRPVLLPAVLKAPPDPTALFSDTAVARGLDHTSELRPFDELSRQRLLPRRLNGQGPGLATGDVNGDGTPDIYVTGSAGQSGVLFLTDAAGDHTRAESQPWSAEAGADDVDAVFFDLNGDGAPDLFVSAGGVEPSRGEAILNDRVYLNDGTGRFTAAPPGILPPDGEATGAVAAADIDGDGDTDLFVGGRFVPGNWPETPRSFLYLNEDGVLVDATDATAPGLGDVGMVTDALFRDIDGNGHVDLLLTIEWGAVTCFKNNGTSLTRGGDALGLTERTGWWNALAVADLNGDDLADIVVGNVGLNTKYHASTDEPTLILVGDFDGNGREQIVEAQYDKGGLYPMRGRSKLAYSFPWLTRKYRNFRDFAQATIDDIFTDEQRAGVTTYEATELASGVFFQRADGTFSFSPLPREAQAAPIHTIAIADFDGDGNLDLFCAGNNFGGEPSTGRFDGGLGTLLLGDGAGDFTPTWPVDSGISVPGEARASLTIPVEGTTRPALLVSRTSGPLLYFTPSAAAD